MDEAIAKTIEKLQNRIKERDEKSLADKRMINQLCELEGAPPMFADESLVSHDGGSSAVGFRPDQFYGRPMATVVREILERRTQRVGAIPLDELFEIMKAGGYDFQNTNEAIAKRSVAITIGKNPAFAKVPNTGHIGLSEWYPNAKKEKRNGDATKEDEATPSGDATPEPTPPKVAAVELKLGADKEAPNE